ncbi:MAG: tryptophan synthase subunit alpha [Spirochaetia bacterium]|nr:tryptophan synthase subunit alpha [Spirochaetia bacterium]
MKTKQKTELEEYLIKRKSEKKLLFIPYLAFSYPDLELCHDIIEVLIEEGADTIELGLPFTDPIADGPVLQKVFKKVLEKPFHISDLIKFLEKINAKHPQYPFLLMGYANMFLQKENQALIKNFYERNIKGIIVPDLPFHEKMRLHKKDKSILMHDTIPWIDFATPTTTDDRLTEIAEHAGGFIYVVSTKGVTGQKDFSLKPLKPLFEKLKKLTDVPLIVGFGVRNNAHVQEVSKYADGFIIGSKIHEIIDENINHLGKIPVRIRQMVRELFE